MVRNDDRRTGSLKTLVGFISSETTTATVATTVTKANISKLRGSAAAPTNSAKVATIMKTMTVTPTRPRLHKERRAPRRARIPQLTQSVPLPCVAPPWVGRLNQNSKLLRKPNESGTARRRQTEADVNFSTASIYRRGRDNSRTDRRLALQRRVARIVGQRYGVTGTTTTGHAVQLRMQPRPPSGSLTRNLRAPT